MTDPGTSPDAGEYLGEVRSLCGAHASHGYLTDAEVRDLVTAFIMLDTLMSSGDGIPAEWDYSDWERGEGEYWSRHLVTQWRGIANVELPPLAGAEPAPGEPPTGPRPRQAPRELARHRPPGTPAGGAPAGTTHDPVRGPPMYDTFEAAADAVAHLVKEEGRWPGVICHANGTFDLTWQPPASSQPRDWRG